MPGLLPVVPGGASANATNDLRNRPVAEAIARSNAMRHAGKERIEAKVMLGKQVHALGTGNQGIYQQLDMGPLMRARVELHLPEAKPGDLIALSVMDGGRILLQDADRSVSEAKERNQTIGADRKVSFLFETGTNEGIYRVLARRGLETRHLEFWVGAKPALSKRPAPEKTVTALTR